jgi:hypothetical protein
VAVAVQAETSTLRAKAAGSVCMPLLQLRSVEQAVPRSSVEARNLSLACLVAIPHKVTGLVALEHLARRVLALQQPVALASKA